jgi:hypothetical protein
MGPIQFNADFFGIFPKFIVNLQYCIVVKVEPNARNAAQPVAIFGWVLQVRVDRLTRESAQTQFTLFFGKLDQILLDLACRWWHAITSFLEYSVKLGRKWITTREALKKSAPNKWRNEIAPFASLRWNIICHNIAA